MGVPLIKPCNFAKARKLPVKVTPPINTSNNMEMLISRGIGCELSNNRQNSATAISAEEAPPKPLSKPTIWGISVICTL